MSSPTRSAFLALAGALLLAAAPSRATDLSGQWQPDSKQNARLFKQAEKEFRKSRPKGGGPGGGDRGGPPPGGGMGGPPSGDAGGTGGPPPGGPPGGPHGGAPEPTVLLPPEAAFAAPTEDALILYRSRDSVMFGRDGSDAVVVVPFAGATDLGNGVQASLRDEADQWVLQIETRDGRRANFRYSIPDPAAGGLRIDIDLGGGMPGGGFKLQRVYRRTQVDVGAPQPDGASG
ncbi:MAG: hypothetical protein QM599_09235 [Pseudoxanthomonas sp.]